MTEHLSIPVLRGPLVAESYARELVASEAPDPVRDARRSRAYRGFARWWDLTQSRHGPATGARTLHAAAATLLRLLGYRPVPHLEICTRDRVEAVVSAGRSGRVAAMTTAWNVELGHEWRTAATLGVRASASWCLAFNGTALRLVDAARPYARRFLEFDLAAASRHETAFAVLWTLAHADAVCGDGSPGRLEAIVAASARQQALVCSALDRGVRAAYDELAAALSRGAGGTPRSGGPPVSHQALTVVFRLLFLFYAEARGLAPLHHPVYRRGYSMRALVDAGGRETARGLWPALRASMRLAHAGCRVRDLRVTAYNGRLFSPDQAPLAERVKVADQTVRRVVSSMSVRPHPHGGAPVPVPYGELDVEQLGAIYERLMDAAPADDRPAAASERKATGSFYTPRALTGFVVRRTLAPLVEGRGAGAILALRVLDPAMGSGAFLVAACRFLAAAYERALVADGTCRSTDVSPRDRAGFRRLVAQRCLYGVDLNPMAVQLARLSLWLTTLAADRPLTFLDHRLLAGDSLVGASAADIARQPPGRGGRRRNPGALPLLAGLEMASPLRECVATRLRLASVPDDDVGIVHDKERALRELDADEGPLGRWRRAADVWCSAWFWPESPVPGQGVIADLLAAALGGPTSLRPRQQAELQARVREFAASHRPLHWTLAFPEVFATADGRPREDAGFDAVLGNPPWDMLRAEDGTSAASAARLNAFLRESGLYTASGEAHVNRFQLFVERSLDLLRSGGRFGLITPWGLLGDAGSAAVRRRLLELASTDAVVAFDNRKAVFPIHRSTRFVVTTGTRSATTRSVSLRPGLVDTEGLDTIADRGVDERDFPIVITRAALDALSPEDLSFPDVRSPRDLATLLAIRSAHPSLAAPEGWGVRFGRELNATDDRHRFTEGPEGCPVIEGKMLVPFAVNTSGSRWRIPRSVLRGLRQAPALDMPRLAYRDVASPGNRLTLIAAVVPAGAVTTHTVFCSRTPAGRAPRLVLCALLNSLVANWYVRHWVSTHVTTAIVHRLPVPVVPAGSPAFRRLVALADRCGNEGTGGAAYVELQALCAQLYGVPAGSLARMLESFPLIATATREAILSRHAEAGAPEWDPSGAGW
jgi:hypothetical protein